MAARSDGDNYGKLLLYEFPKQELIYGPSQIEARIDQTPEISQQLSLWDQQGSRVIRGNLLVIPIEQSILYIEPIYLRAEQGELPQLKRVVVAHGDNLVMRPTLESAISAVFGEETVPPPPAQEQPTAQTPIPNNLTQRAINVYRDAQQAAQAGNWGEYGDKIKELEGILEQLHQQE